MCLRSSSSSSRPSAARRRPLERSLIHLPGSRELAPRSKMSRLVSTHPLPSLECFDFPPTRALRKPQGRHRPHFDDTKRPGVRSSPDPIKSKARLPSAASSRPATFCEPPIPLSRLSLSCPNTAAIRAQAELVARRHRTRTTPLIAPWHSTASTEFDIDDFLSPSHSREGTRVPPSTFAGELR